MQKLLLRKQLKRLMISKSFLIRFGINGCQAKEEAERIAEQDKARQWPQNQLYLLVKVDGLVGTDSFKSHPSKRSPSQTRKPGFPPRPWIPPAPVQNSEVAIEEVLKGLKLGQANSVIDSAEAGVVSDEPKVIEVAADLPQDTEKAASETTATIDMETTYTTEPTTAGA
eukprot:m.270511 g.270511  ORF g.270511 m.270511 type:complete len:169 (+) comp16264_c0_seq7:2817-3323(+)